MTTLSDFSQPLLTSLQDARNIKNLDKLLNSIMSKGTTKLASLGDLSELRSYTRLLKSGTLSVDLINRCLLNNVAQNIPSESTILVPLDGMDIRKKYSKKNQYLDRVQDLDHKTVNGYHSYSAIAIEQESQKKIKNLHLLSLVPYSTKTTDFQSKNLQFKDLISSINSQLPNNILYILDREFDNEQLLEFIISTKNNYLVRVKHLNRIVKHQGFETKIIDIDNFQTTRVLQDISIKNKHLEKVTNDLSWTEIEISGIRQTLIRSNLSQNRKPIYDKPLYLLVSKTNLDEKAIFEYYLNYFLRWKIETVFKYIKNTFGLEEFRIQDFQGISNILALTFLVAGYHYSLSVNIDKEELIRLSNYGGGLGKLKGKQKELGYSLYYIQVAIMDLLAVKRFNKFLTDNDIGKEEAETLLNSISGFD